MFLTWKKDLLVYFRHKVSLIFQIITDKYHFLFRKNNFFI